MSPSVDGGESWIESSTRRTGIATFRSLVPGTALRAGDGDSPSSREDPGWITYIWRALMAWRSCDRSPIRSRGKA